MGQTHFQLALSKACMKEIPSLLKKERNEEEEEKYVLVPSSNSYSFPSPLPSLTSASRVWEVLPGQQGVSVGPAEVSVSHKPQSKGLRTLPTSPGQGVGLAGTVRSSSAPDSAAVPSPWWRRARMCSPNAGNIRLVRDIRAQSILSRDKPSRAHRSKGRSCPGALGQTLLRCD